jgi:hypothetical protein
MASGSSARQGLLSTRTGSRNTRVGLALGMYPPTEQTMFWVSKLFQDSTTRMDKWSARYIVMVNLILINNHVKLAWWNQVLVSLFWLSLASAQLLWIRLHEKHYRKHRNSVAYFSRWVPRNFQSRRHTPRSASPNRSSPPRCMLRHCRAQQAPYAAQPICSIVGTGHRATPCQSLSMHAPQLAYSISSTSQQ